MVPEWSETAFGGDDGWVREPPTEYGQAATEAE